MESETKLPSNTSVGVEKANDNDSTLDDIEYEVFSNSEDLEGEELLLMLKKMKHLQLNVPFVGIQLNIIVENVVSWFAYYSAQ